MSNYTESAIITNAANIRFGTNPVYTIADFLAVYPQFDVPEIPTNVLQMFINLANACISELRWGDAWSFAMALFVAHYCTLHLQSSTAVDSTAKQVASAGINRGVMVSKSVGDVSVSYQAVTTGFESWGQWNLTLFGQQFIDMASIIGRGAMVIW